MENDLALLIPEKTILTYRLASFGSRVLAHLLDLVLVYGIFTVLGFIATLVGWLDGGLAQALLMVGGFAAPFLYFILSEWLWNGQTVGKKVAGLRVRMDDGTPVTFMAAVGRNLLRIADFLPFLYFAGLAAMFMNPRSQRIGDLVAHTVVVHEKRPGMVYGVAPHTVGVHPFEDRVGNLHGMTLEEYDALRRLCDRFPELTVDAQNRLLHEVWGPIATRRKIPQMSEVHPLYLAEATVMKYGRQHGLL